VVEYVPGGTLADQPAEPLLPRTAAELIVMIAEGVAASHQVGALHLDLKPSNVLLESAAKGRQSAPIPRVCDFGVSRPCDPSDVSLFMTDASGPIGTPSYMAPEQVTGDNDAMDARTDVYGLGAILYTSSHWPSAICVVVTARDSPAGSRAGTGRAAAAQSVDPARFGNDLPQMSGKGCPSPLRRGKCAL
jgi:serine/threonine protein kinase